MRLCKAVVLSIHSQGTVIVSSLPMPVLQSLALPCMGETKVQLTGERTSVLYLAVSIWVRKTAVIPSPVVEI